MSFVPTYLINTPPDDDSPFEAVDKINQNLENLASELEGLSTRYEAYTVTIDGGATPIQPGDKGWLPMPFAGTVLGWYLVADPAIPGSIIIDVWKDTFANYPPTSDDSICGSSLPAISNDVKANNLSLSGWNVGVIAGDIFWFHVNSCSLLRRVTLTLLILQT